MGQVSFPAHGSGELLAPKTFNGERAMLPFPLQRVKSGCGPIPLAPAAHLPLAIAVLQHTQALGGFKLIKKGFRHQGRGYHIKCECEGKHKEETRPDRKTDNGGGLRQGPRQSATKKLECPVSFDLLELRATDIEKDKESGSRLQHLEPAWYLVGLPKDDHNDDCTKRASAKADLVISIPRALVSDDIVHEMLELAAPLLVFTELPRRKLFDTIAATPGPHGPWGNVLKAKGWGPDNLWFHAIKKAAGVRLRPTAARADGGEERDGQVDAMMLEGVNVTMRDMFLDMRAMVEAMGGARGVLDPRALEAVQQLQRVLTVISRTKGHVLPELSRYAEQLDGCRALEQAVGIHDEGGSLGLAELDDVEVLPPPHEGGGGGRRKVSILSGRKAKQPKPKKSKHEGRGQSVGSGGGGGAGDVPSTIEGGPGPGLSEGTAHPPLSSAAAVAQSSMAAAPSGKENVGNVDGNLCGGKESPPSGAIPPLRVVSRPGESNPPPKRVKLILRLPISDQEEALPGGLRDHQHQEEQGR